MEAQLNIIENLMPTNTGQVNQPEGGNEGAEKGCFAEELHNQQEKLENETVQPTSDNKPTEKAETENSTPSKESAEPEKTKENTETSPKTENNKNTDNTTKNTGQPAQNADSAKEVIVSSQIQTAQKVVLKEGTEVVEKQQNDGDSPKLTNGLSLEPVQKQAVSVNLQANAENLVKNGNNDAVVVKNEGNDNIAQLIQAGQQIQNAVSQKTTETVQINQQGNIKGQEESINPISSNNTAVDGEKGEAAQQNVQSESKLLNQVQNQVENKTVEPQQSQQQQQTIGAEINSKQKDAQVDVFSAEKNNAETNTTEKITTQLAASAQMQAGQKEGKNSSDVGKNGLNQNMEQIMAGNLLKEQNAEQVNNSNQVKFANQANNPTEGIERQIQESIQSSIQQGTKQITIRLNPPELGSVSLKFEERNGEITGLLEVSKSETRYLVEHAFPQIIRNLADSGIVIKKLDVALSNTAEQNSGANGFLNTGQNQQQDFGAEGQSTAGNTYFDYSSELEGNTDYFAGGAEAGMVSDSSINILI